MRCPRPRAVHPRQPGLWTAFAANRMSPYIWLWKWMQHRPHYKPEACNELVKTATWFTPLYGACKAPEKHAAPFSGMDSEPLPTTNPLSGQHRATVARPDADIVYIETRSYPVLFFIQNRQRGRSVMYSRGYWQGPYLPRHPDQPQNSVSN